MLWTKMLGETAMMVVRLARASVVIHKATQELRYGIP